MACVKTYAYPAFIFSSVDNPRNVSEIVAKVTALASCGLNHSCHSFSLR